MSDSEEPISGQVAGPAGAVRSAEERRADTSQRLPALGLFGGSFDPIHLGHLALAEEVLAKVDLARVVFIPSHLPPHKRGHHSAVGHRLAMLKLALADNPRFELDTRELARSELSYTIDTLRDIRAEVGAEVSLNFIVGWDSWQGFAGWRCWCELFDYANFVVVKRPGYSGLDNRELETLLDDCEVHADTLSCFAAGKVALVNTTPWEISSSGVRAALAAGESAAQWLPPAVDAYICQHQPYVAASH